MELNGEEKTIRALFREMRLEDERATPPFAREWKRKASAQGAPHRFGRAVFAVAMVCLILVSTFMLRRNFWKQPVWHESAKQSEMNRRPGQEQLARREGVGEESKEAGKPKNRVARRPGLNGASRKARLASPVRRRKGEDIFVSNWQSPTRTFLRSPVGELLRSVPQLDQSSLELRSFLNSGLN